jgi:hypothetical protein
MLPKSGHSYVNDIHSYWTVFRFHALCNAQITENIFDSLPSLAPLRRSTAAMDELRLFLNMEPENVTNAVQWWYENRTTYPRLYRMALDYLTIPGKYLGRLRTAV